MNTIDLIKRLENEQFITKSQAAKLAKTASTLQRLAALEGKNKLVAAYIAVAVDDEFSTEKSLLGWLNEQCGTKYKSTHWSDWKNGQRPVPSGIAAQMRREILQYLFADEAADALMAVLDLERLTPVNKISN